MTLSSKNILTFLRRNALFTSILIGITGYWIFTHTTWLVPIGRSAGPLLTDWMPIGMFLLLYFTFCRIQISDLRPHVWHLVIQAVRATLSATTVVIICLIGEGSEWKLIMEGVFICFICPTAAAVVVVAEKLGGSVGSLTVFTIIANIVTMIIIPLLFPLVEREAGITFLSAALMLLKNVFLVLVAPLALALLSRRIMPRIVTHFNHHRNISFYLWCINLMIVSGITVGNIEHSTVSGQTLWALLLLPLPVCIMQFAIGKAVGRHWNDSISAGQALGQKNTVVGIWLTITFLNPLAAVAPGAYVLWQNLVNGWQIWYKEKYGRLIW